MTLLTVVRDVCAVVGVQAPTSVFASLAANRTMQEMVALANEMAQRISYDTREWSLLKLVATYNGDGVTTAFNLPVNFKRMLLTGNVWRSTSTLQPMTFIADTDEWMQRRLANNTSSAWGEWTMLGGQILIYPPMGVGVTATHAYLDQNCVTRAAGGVADRFVADGDQFRLAERLLKLGMIWQWKAQKGSPYAEDMGTYGDALQVAMGNDSPSPIIIDRLPASFSGRVAYPWPVPS